MTIKQALKKLFNRGNSTDISLKDSEDAQTINGGRPDKDTLLKDDSSPKKETDQQKKSEETPDQHQKNASMLSQIIKPEERTMANYLNPVFWLENIQEYRSIKHKERVGLDTYEILSEGALPSIEYYILTILSCIIATIGLIQGSTAIIIGAMIVAPLMTPILAFSLAVIWGDLHLIRTSLMSVIKGTLLAVVISAAIAFIVPIPEYSFEITSRTVPSLFDILVALASGIVGAYGYANKKISNTIIGIAIAVALMPPLCTIGIGIGTFNFSIASGAAILYVINLISIALAGAIIFWLMRIYPFLADRGDVTRRALWQIVISIIILSSIAVPVAFFMYEQYQIVNAKITARKLLENEFTDISIMNIGTKKSKGGIILYITLTSRNFPDEKDKWRMRNITDQFLGHHPELVGIKINFLHSQVILE